MKTSPNYSFGSDSAAARGTRVLPMTLLIGQSNTSNAAISIALARRAAASGGRLEKFTAVGSVLAPIASTRKGSWAPGIRGQLFDDLTERLGQIAAQSAARNLAYQVQNVVFIQGEGDTWGPIAARDYLRNFHSFFTALSSQVGFERFVLCTLSGRARPGAAQNGRSSSWQTVRRCQMRVSGIDPRIMIVDPDALGRSAQDMFQADGFHYRERGEFIETLAAELADVAFA